MFPFPKGELCFQVPNNNVEQDVKNGALNATNNAGFNFDHLSTVSGTNTKKHCLEKSLTNGQEDACTNKNVKQGKINDGDDVANKRVLHRETERQRRQEMATLYSSLRSILPLEYIKGKRSMCDHILEATKYIKDLEKNVKELGYKRDHLKKETCCLSSTKLHVSPSSSRDDNCSVSIHTFSKAIKIEICEGVVEEDPFPLSRVLRVLYEQGLDVVSCVTSKLSNKRVYVIHCEAEDVASIDSYKLQSRLNSEIRKHDQMI